MKSTINGDFKKDVVKSPKQSKKLSLGELVKKNNQKEKYNGLLNILEPQEKPWLNRK